MSRVETWRLAMSSSGGGDVWLRVRAVCVAGAAGSVRVREEHVEDNRAHVPRRRRAATTATPTTDDADLFGVKIFA